MARSKKTLNKYESDAGILDQLYLELSDDLRSMQMDKIRIEEAISDLQTLLREEESKKDPNKNIFHVYTSNSDVETDEIRSRIHEKQLELGNKDAEIALFQTKLDALHTARRVLTRFSKETGSADDQKAESINVPEMPKAQDISVDTPDEPAKKHVDLKQAEKQLSTCLDSIELALRVTGFDPERARIELSEVKDKINDLLCSIKEG